MRDTALLQLALGLTAALDGEPQRLRPRGTPARHRDRLRPGQPLCLSDAAVRRTARPTTPSG